jgi:hypothetical protein
MIYGILSGHGIWWPVNLLAGMAVPGVGNLSTAEMEQFRPPLVALGIAIHIVVSLILGLVYGVLMPMLPRIPKPLAWGALVMPLLWTAWSYGLMGVVNPVLQQRVDWPWFVVSQFVFGLVAAIVVVRSEEIAVPPAGHGLDHPAERAGDSGKH